MQTTASYLRIIATNNDTGAERVVHGVIARDDLIEEIMTERYGLSMSTPTEQLTTAQILGALRAEGVRGTKRLASRTRRDTSLRLVIEPYAG